METYNGHVRTPADAIILFEACRLGHLPRVQRRLSEKERQQIKSGSVFVWDEREAGMRRWTDGKSWSASRVSGSFLTYREMEGKRGGPSFSTPAQAVKRTVNGSAKESGKGGDGDMEMGEDGPDGYRYKPDGLMKQSFSITTSQGQHLHLISYYARSHPSAATMLQPSNDPALRHVRPAKGMYPESTVHEQNAVPAVTRSPMIGSPYANSPNQMNVHAPGYARASSQHPHPLQYPPSHVWPPSPMSTPPAHHYSPYMNGGAYRHPSSSGTSPMQYEQSHQSPHQRPSGPTAFDRAPAPMPGGTSLPPPPPPPTSHSQNGYPTPTYQPPYSQPYHPPANSPLTRPLPDGSALQHQPQHPPPPQQPPQQYPQQHPQQHQQHYPPQYQQPYPQQQHLTQPHRQPSPGGPKIDPRLASPHQRHVNAGSNGHHQQSVSAPRAPVPEIPRAQDNHTPSAIAKSIPSIGALINNSPPPSASPSDSLIDKAIVGAPGMQSENTAFGEDKRALRQLDRAFVP